MKIVVVPIEIPSRELIGKIKLMYKEYGDRGYTLVFGDMVYLTRYINSIHGGVVIWKNIGCAKTTKLLNNIGNNKIIVHHEEGFVIDKKYIDLFDRELIDKSSYIFHWGPYQDNLFKNNFVEYLDKSKVVGHPRLDLSKLNAASKIRQNKKTAKINVLFNSRYSNINNKNGKEYSIRYMKEVYKDDDFVEATFDQAEREYNFFWSCLKQVASMDIFNVSFRAHPAEDTYKANLRAKSIPGVTINNDSDINEAISRNDVIVASQCTTQFEAFLGGKKVVVLRADSSDESVMFPWIDEISGVAVNSIEALIAELKDLSFDRKAIIDRIENEQTICDPDLVRFSNPTSPEKIVDILDSIDFDSAGYIDHLSLFRYIAAAFRSNINKIRGRFLKLGAEYFWGFNRSSISKILGVEKERLKILVPGRVWYIKGK